MLPDSWMRKKVMNLVSTETKLLQGGWSAVTERDEHGAQCEGWELDAGFDPAGRDDDDDDELVAILPQVIPARSHAMWQRKCAEFGTNRTR